MPRKTGQRAGTTMMAPVGHIVTRADLEITLDMDGHFINVSAVDKSEPKIIIPATRSWQTVAAYYNTRSWRKLLSTLNLPLYNALHRERVPQKITVAIHHDYDFRE